MVGQMKKEEKKQKSKRSSLEGVLYEQIAQENTAKLASINSD